MRTIKRAIITGPTGAIGTALIAELICNDIEVLAIVRNGSNRISNIPNSDKVKVIECDLSELDRLQNEDNEKYDVFYHLAWAGTSGSARNDMYLQNQNVMYSLDAVNLAKRYGCSLFIGAGSQAEYGRVKKPLLSTSPTFPENGYGYAKLCAGFMTRDYAHQLGLEHIWTRILSIYGPNDNPNSLVMSAIRAFSNNEVFKCTKGEQVWDYLYSDDAAKALLTMALEAKDGDVIPLGSGKTRLLKDFISDIRDVINPDCAIDFGAVPYNPNQVMFLQCMKNYIIDQIKPIEFKKGIENIIK